LFAVDVLDNKEEISNVGNLKLMDAKKLAEIIL
jgi:hypothetical protein